MADQKITALTALTGANSAPGDLLTLVDVSDTTMDAAGTNKSITRQELQTYNAGTLTTDVKVLDLSATWNGGAVTFTGFKFNVTDTASATASVLLDLQVGGTSKVKIRKDGRVQFGTAGQEFEASGSYRFLIGSTVVRCAISDGFTVGAGGFFRFTSDASAVAGTPDISFHRLSAGNLEQRAATVAQSFLLYRTWSDASNYQRLTKTWSTSTAVIHNEGAGTGADGSIAFNDAALATDTTKGFIMIPSCAGAPTGTPADIPTGQIPIVFDSTNNKLYVYDGGWISTAALT